MISIAKITQLRFKWMTLFMLLILSLPGEVFSQCSQLVWQDEFNGSSLDLTKWSYQTGNGTNDNLPAGWGNSELQYYTSRKQNVNVTGGNLELIALYEPNYLGTGANYTSGRIRSTNPVTNNPRNEWQYGSFEARIKVPEPFADSRAWPGFWMLPHNGPWPNTGEIDIMETGNNNNPWYYNGTLHYGTGYPGFISGTGGVTINTASSCPAGNVGDLSVCFHLYRVDWTPNSIKFFVDNVQVGATQTNATVGSGGVIGANWPFDAANPFHLIFNMAVGGYFPGSSPINNARFPLKMLVDYVRVYSTPAAVKITGKTKILQGQTGITYSVSNVAGNTYNWSVPAGATITAGQNTNQITVNYGASAASGNVSVTITPTAGGCSASTNSLAISVLTNACTINLENFETANPPTRNLGFNIATGWLNRANTSAPSFPYGTFTNPSATGVNTSANVGKYERNAGVAYDVLAYNDIVIGNAADFKNGIVRFNMDVYSTAPAGTQVMIQLENTVNAQTGWPNGIHSRYTAVTGTPNTWSTLQFTLLDSPDASMPATDVDQIVLLFNPNTYTNHIYYFDNFKRVGVTPTTSAITGQATVCQNNSGVTYSVTGLAGSTYNWSVPTGASIVSGQGTNTITVNFGTTSGNITVTETSAAKCVGTAKTLAVSVTGTCTLTANFSASKLNTCAGAVIVFTDLTTGKTGGETYSWDFGAGASLPAGTTGAGPFNVTYSTGGSKNVSLTVTRPGSTDAEVKNGYITIAAPPTGCLFSDDYNNATVNWITPIPGAFTHAEAGTAWTISNGGYGEWENFVYTLNNGSTASPMNFGCAANAPLIKIRAKASANALLRIQLMDGNGLATDNVPGFNLELTTTYQTFTINYATYLKNFYSPTPGALDSTNINRLQFFINPGYVSYPYAGTNKTYNTSFAGTVDIDWIGIGNNCFFPGTAPTISSFNPACGNTGTSVTITGTNLSGATSVTFNGVVATIVSNTATQLVVTAPSAVTNGKITVTNPGGTVSTATNFNLGPMTMPISGPASACANSTGIIYSVTNTLGSTYNWTLPTGATITAGNNTNSITVSFGTVGGNISVTETNSFGCIGIAQVKAVTINAKPTTSTITGSTNVCANATGVVYSVTNTTGSTYNWSLPAGATITAGNNTRSITVTFGTTGGNVSVTETNAAGCVGTAVVKAVTVNTKPVTSTITGPATVCANSTGVVYSVTNTTGSTYNWTLPTGATITAGNNSNSITVTFGTAGGNVSVTETNTAGCVGTAVVKAITINPKPTTSAITGSTSACANSTGIVYSVTNTTGSTYNWTLPTGASITAGNNTNSITVTFGTASGNVSVTETNASGCIGTAVVKAVTINAKPTTSTITGLTSVCANSTGIVYSVTHTTGSSYSWLVPTGATITAGNNTNSITVSFGTTGGNVSVTEANAAGCTGTAVVKAVTLNPLPNTSVISGNASPACNATGITYSVTPTTGSTYNWSVPSGATITSGQSTNAITVNFGTTNGNVAVVETNAAGCIGASRTLTISLTGCGLAANYNGSPLAICAGSTVTFTNTSTGTSGATSYLWNFGTGASPATATTAGPHTVTYSTTGAKTVSLQITDGASKTETKSNYITVNAIPGTNTITGPASVCANSTGNIFSVPATTGSTYNWSLPVGAIISSGTNTNSITVSFGNTSGTIGVIETNSFGCVGTQATKGVTVNSIPNTSAISGNITPACNATGVTYSVTPTSGSTYNWTVPSGATITSGSNTNAVTVSFGSTGGGITVTETNSSGCVGAVRNITVSLSGCGVNADFTGAPLSICEGETVTFTDASVGTTVGTSYTWNFGSGANPATATTAGPHTVTYTTSGTKTVSLQIVEGVTKSVTKTNYVTVNALPTIANAGPDQIITASSTTLAGNSPTIGTGNWTIVSSNGSPAIVNTSLYNSMITALATGATTLRWTISNASCISFDEVTINTSTPSIGNITGPSSVVINNTYTYSIGGTGTFTWTVPAGATIVSGQGSNTIQVTFSNLNNGDITVTDGTSTTSLPVTVNNVTSVLPYETGAYYLSPNPFQEEAVLKINSVVNSNMHLKIIDMHGITVFESDEFHLNENINLGKDLPSGIYTVLVNYDNSIKAIKIVKSK